MTLQSMKMEITITAESDGTIAEILVSEGDEIDRSGHRPAVVAAPLALQSAETRHHSQRVVGATPASPGLLQPRAIGQVDT